MLEDMRMRKLAPKTREAYIRAVSRFAKYLGRSPDTATAEDLRLYQLHLVDSGTSPITLNATITGLKFLFDVTLGHGDVLAKMQSVRVPHKIPVVLNKQEVARLIACAGNLKHQTALALAYGTGLRVSEVISLKVSDIDSQRMTLRVEQGKGGRDRYAMISPILLERLRVWWRVARAQGKMLNGGWLFPGRDPIDPLTAKQLNRAIHEAATLAKIDKRVSMHTLRHYPEFRNIPSDFSAPLHLGHCSASWRVSTRHIPWLQSPLRKANSLSSGRKRPTRPGCGSTLSSAACFISKFASR